MKALKTPLRYPGGKSKLAPNWNNIFQTFVIIRSIENQFLGGGSVANTYHQEISSP